MKLSSLHVLLTYQCTFECDHCFVWGSPFQSGTLTLPQIRNVLRQAEEMQTVRSIYFEGGEPFLFYMTLLKSVQETVQMGFQVGLVTNAYWATSVDDAVEWLKPFAGLLYDLSISNDLYHWSEASSQQVNNATIAAKQLGIPLGILSVAQPEATNAACAIGQLPPGESTVMYRGRAIQQLVPKAARHPWNEFTECPHEDLHEPGRVHLDPLGNVQICQGISLGNIFEHSLEEICDKYDPPTHPITGPLLEGGPVELAREYNVPHGESYADACHLCYETRLALRDRFPGILQPDQMYGVRTFASF